MDTPAISLLIAFLAVAAVAYALPSIIAFNRGHPNRWLILIINMAGGITGFGWLLMLLWACHAVHRPDRNPATVNGGQSGLNVLINDGPNKTDLERKLTRLSRLLRDGHISRAEHDTLRSRALREI